MSLTRQKAGNLTYKNDGTGAVVRTIKDKLGETVSVKDFGAVGDGVTDDTVAIQAAIDYSKANGVKLYASSDDIFLFNSTLNFGNNIILEGNGCTFRKNFDGVGFRLTGGANPNELRNIYLVGYGPGLADSSTATSGHGIEIVNNSIRFYNVVSNSHKGHGFRVEASSPNMNNSQWGLGGYVQASGNDGHGVFFTGSNDNTSIWTNMNLLITANRGQGVYMSTAWMGRQWDGFWYLEDNSQGGGYSVGGEVVSNYVGKLRYSNIMIYAEENAAGVTKDIYFDTNTDGNNLISTRLNRWADLGIDNKIFRGSKEQSWNLQHRYRTVRGISVSASTDYMEDYFVGSSSAAEISTERHYGSGKYEKRQRKTSNGKIQRLELEHPYLRHTVFDTSGVGYFIAQHSNGTEAAPTASQIGEGYHIIGQVGDGTTFKNITYHKMLVTALGGGKPGGKHVFSANQSGASAPVDVAEITYNAVYPSTDGGADLGTPSNRWKSLRCATTTVANLPTASTNTAARFMVSDSTVAASSNFGATVAGGGSNVVPVFSDGTNWLIG